MKKGRFRLIVAVMSLALLGLIFLQTYWILHDFEIKSQQFDRSVMLAMNNIVDKIEEVENMKIVVKNFITTDDSLQNDPMIDDSLRNILGTIINEPPPPPPPPGGPQPFDGRNHELSRIQEEINNRIYDFRQRARNRKPTEEGMVFNIDSSIDIRIERDIEQKEVYALKINQSRELLDSLEEVTRERMQTRLKRLNSMMQKLTFQIVDPSEDIFDRISHKTLDSIIRSELKNRDLDINFNYGVYNDRKKDWAYLSPDADSVMLKYSDYKLIMFPNDVFKRNEQLSLSFRDKLNYLLDGIWMVLLLSLMFTIIIIWGFTYTMKVILRQKKLADMKNDFINNMTHEFKTPIATISLANESIRDPRIHQSPEKLELYTGIIRDENQRMLHQVETVLQMAQLDKGELKLKKEACNVASVIEDAVASMTLTIEQRNGSIEVVNDATDAEVYGDHTHLLNIFINILDNANKYSPDQPLINIRLYNKESFVCVDITDHGIGMTKDVLKRIFENFYRATSGNIHDVKGFGLGLSYVKAIIDEHNGEIDVKSEPGQGSTFSIKLPLNTPSK